MEGLPIYILGVSTGGQVAIAALADCSDNQVKRAVIVNAPTRHVIPSLSVLNLLNRISTPIVFCSGLQEGVMNCFTQELMKTARNANSNIEVVASKNYSYREILQNIHFFNEIVDMFTAR